MSKAHLRATYNEHIDPRGLGAGRLRPSSRADTHKGLTRVKGMKTDEEKAESRLKKALRNAMKDNPNRHVESTIKPEEQQKAQTGDRGR